jgi:hypothetical protein
MSLLGAFRQEQPTSQPTHIERPEGNRLKLADQLRFRQMERMFQQTLEELPAVSGTGWERMMERMLQQTLEELEQAKTRVSQLEKALAERAERDIAACSGSGQQTSASLTPLLPIAEISQIAKMAKRFK